MTRLCRAEPPYVMLRSDCPACTGNTRYEGFAIDLLDAISKAFISSALPQKEN